MELAEELGESKIVAALSGGPVDKQVVELRRQVSRMVDDLKNSNERVSSKYNPSILEQGRFHLYMHYHLEVQHQQENLHNP